MRVLVHPIIGLRKVTADSNFILYSDIADHLIKNGCFVHMILPEFAREYVPAKKGMMYHFQPERYDFYTDMVTYDPKLLVGKFSRMFGEYQIDAILTSKPAMVPLYRSALSDHLRARDISCYVIEAGVFHEESDKRDMRMLLVQTALGYVSATSMFLSERERLIAKQMCSKYVSPSMLKRFEKESLVIPVGVPMSKIDPLIGTIPKNDKFTLFFGARLNSVKQPDRIVELYNYLYAKMGDDVHVTITTNTQIPKISGKDGKPIFEGKEAFEVHYECDRATYLKHAMASHVSICWSTEESFGVGWLEQMYMGLPVLYIDKEWSRRILPDDYPWFFKDKVEAYTMIEYIKENYDQVVADMQKYRDWIATELDEKKVYADLYDRLKADAHLPLTYSKPANTQRLVERAAEALTNKTDGKPFSLDQLIDMMTQLGAAFNPKRERRALNAKYVSDYDIYRMMLNAGYRDVAVTAKPIFQKVVDWDGTDLL